MTGPTETAWSWPLRPDLALTASLVPAGARVLDLGCGNGDLLRHLVDERGCSGTGVEIDPDQVVAAIGQGVNVIEYDLDTQLGAFADRSYDVVVLSRTLQTVRMADQVLTEMSRIAPRLIVSMPNFGFWRHRLRLLSGHMPHSRELPYAWWNTPNLHHSTLVDLEDLFASLGLRVEQRVPLNEKRRPSRWSGHSANLLAGSAVYVLCGGGG